MTAITQNLPWFIKDLGISIVGKKCYTSLVEELNVSDVPCLKYALSKGLGVGIVLGGSIMKLPQILLIVNASSARGLSLPAYVLETLSYAITLAYSMRNHFPFSTYGENFFLAVQNTIITFLIIIYGPRSSPKSSKLAITALSAAATTFALSAISQDTLAYLQLSTLPLSLFSKLPQIRQNARSGSTGQLSAFAVISQIAGCLARLYTTATEVGDRLVSAGFALALLLNIVLGAQLWMYWGQGLEKDKESYELGNGVGRSGVAAGKARLSPPLYEPAPKTATPVPAWQQQQHLASPVARAATPPSRQGTPNSAGGRKWTRKVD